MSLQITQETIDQYLNQQLTGAELTAFQAKLNTDATFKKEIETQQFLHRGVQKHGQDQLRSKLKNIRAELLADDKNNATTNHTEKAKVVPLGNRKKTNRYSIWAIAASVALLIGALLFIFSPDPAASSSNLFAANYQAYPADLNTKGSTTDLMASINSAYQKGEYKNALPLIMQVLQVQGNNAELKLLKGICQLELDQLDAAAQTFKGIKNELYLEDAIWYQAMVALKVGDESKIHSALKNIEVDNKYYVKAQKILAKMGR